MNNPRKPQSENLGGQKLLVAVNENNGRPVRPRRDMANQSLKLIRARQLREAIKRLTCQHEVVLLDLRSLEATPVLRAIVAARSKTKTPVLILLNDDQAEDAAVKSEGSCQTLTDSIRAATEKMRYAEERAELGRIQSELNLAREIQQSWIPESPSLPGFDIAGHSVALTETCGDLFDFFPMRDGYWGIVLGDVCGHGVGPAMVLSIARAILRSLARDESSIFDLLVRLNRELSLNSPIFMTMVLIRLDPASGRLTYGCAGHEGFLIDADGNVRCKLDGGCPPLSAGIEIADHLIVGTDRLQKGELLFMCTDGVTDNVPSSSRDMFGIQRALEVVKINRDRPARVIVERLFQAARRFSRQESATDDMSSVIIKRTW